MRLKVEVVVTGGPADTRAAVVPGNLFFFIVVM
jgi:hypothetical protein